MSKEQGPGVAQPGEDPENGPLKTIVASGPMLLLYTTLGSVRPFALLGNACVVDSVICKVVVNLTWPLPGYARSRSAVMVMGAVSWLNWPAPTVSWIRLAVTVGLKN